MSALVAGLVGVGVLGALWVSSMKDKKNKVKVSGDKDGIGTGPVPKVPTLAVSGSLVVPVFASMVNSPIAWQASQSMTDEAKMFLAILADETWLYTDQIEKAYEQLAGWVMSKGGSGYLQDVVFDVVKGKPVGEAKIDFDDGLPGAIRALTFWQVSAQQWGPLTANLDSDEFKKYPNFRDSIRKVAEGTGVKPVGFYSVDGGNDNPTPQPKKPGEYAKVNPDNPLTWNLPDADGPATVQTPKGPLAIPEGGKIRGGRPKYVAASGDYGAKIAEKWGKNATWAPAIAKENPDETFGGNGNTVYPGDDLKMPILFLDPTAKNYSGGGGGKVAPPKKDPAGPPPPPGDNDQPEPDDDGDDDGSPPMPTEDPGAGYRWAYDESEERWIKVVDSGTPYGPPPPDADDNSTVPGQFLPNFPSV